ncbi:hypothetical protein Tco_0833449 [Tanacetum coccineum]
MTNLTDMLSKFVNSNTASTSGSRTLPSNTITNPKVDLKGITTQSGVAYQGPTIPTTSSSPPKVVERKTEVKKDMVPPTNNGSTKDVQPPVVQVQTQMPNSEPVVAPVIALMPNLKPSISLTDALILMPKFASTLKALIGNKEKLSEMARTPMDECLALADLGSSINLMPLSVWKKISLPKLTPTCMTLEHATVTITPQPPEKSVDEIERRTESTSLKWLVRIILKKFSVSPIDFLLEEVDAFLALEDDPTLPEVDHSYYDPEGDILLLEAFLNDDPSLPPPTQGNYLPEIRKEL